MNKLLSKKIDAKAWVAAKSVLDSLREHFEADLKALESKAYTFSNYSQPSWSEQQADILGSIRTLKKVITTLNTGK